MWTFVAPTRCSLCEIAIPSIGTTLAKSAAHPGKLGGDRGFAPQPHVVASGENAKSRDLSARLLVRWRWDSNPRWLLTTHAFEACSFGRSDTPPSTRVQEPGS